MNNKTSELQGKRQKGFTLVELIIVIILIGILAVVAAPKFVNLNSNADKASLQGLKGALESQSQLAYIACILTPGCISATWGQVIFVKSLGQNVQILRGYPDAGEIARPDQIDDIIQYSPDYVLTSEESNRTARWSIANTSNCYVQYRQPDNIEGAQPTISIVDTGC